MKIVRTLKFVLPIVVVLAILLFLLLGTGGGDDITSNQPYQPSAQKTQHVVHIEEEINELEQSSVNEFSKDTYERILNRIENNYTNGELGADNPENEQWKEILTKHLYAVYTSKFVDRAFYLFSASEWRRDDLNFIRNETRAIKTSPLLEKGSPADEKFDEILNILNRYDLISNFIAECKNFSYTNYQITGIFPINEVKSKIQTSKEYLNQVRSNQYVNNCRQLNNDLRQVPRTLLNAHINYLRNKVNNSTERFRQYNRHEDYLRSIKTPLERELVDFLHQHEEIYNISDRQSINNIFRTLDNDNNAAWEYFRN